MKALIVANAFLETQLDELRTKVSTGYPRGWLPGVRERNDEMARLRVDVGQFLLELHRATINAF